MRYLGNKTRLLPAIEAVLAERGVTPPGVFFDVFSGSASVARRMKELGWRVVANDHLVCAATQARASLELAAEPTFDGLLARRELRPFAGRGTPLEAVLAFLNETAPREEGLVFRQYSAGGPAGRGFFTADVGRRIDGVRTTLRRWRPDLAPGEEAVLLASLLDALDRCANVSGTYGAFLKKWQPNALAPLVLRPPAIVPGKGSTVHCRDANELVREVEATVLYIDPPYNRRQYAKNYHVLEVVAELAGVADEAGYEASIYGRTGLREFEGRKSAYCMGSVRGATSPCEVAFADLIAGARAEHVLISYNEEGILSREALERTLAASFPGFDMERGLIEVAYRRFRSDRDENGRRSYRVLDGRRRDEVREWLIFASRAQGRRRPRVPRRGRAVRPAR